MFSLAGKVAVVTGGRRGIGKGISLALAQAGATVICTGRTSAPLEATTEQIREQGGRALVLVNDITRPDAAQAAVDRALSEFGRLDIWVNNAGSAAREDVGPLIDLDEGQWDRVVDLNLKWTFFAAQAAVRAMTAGGSIINITSRSGSQPNPMTGQYGAAKAGVENLTGTMAVEWGHLGIRVNAIAPGLVLTEDNAEFMSGPRAQKQIDVVPLGRPARPTISARSASTLPPTKRPGFPASSSRPMVQAGSRSAISPICTRSRRRSRGPRLRHDLACTA